MMKLSERQEEALEAIYCACEHMDPMTYPPRVTSDMEDPRGVCVAVTARSLKKKGLVEWSEYGRSIALTDAGRAWLKEAGLI